MRGLLLLAFVVVVVAGDAAEQHSTLMFRSTGVPPDPVSVYMTAWWELWHQHYTQLHDVASRIHENTTEKFDNNSTLADDEEYDSGLFDFEDVDSIGTAHADALNRSIANMLSTGVASGSSLSEDVNAALLSAQQEVMRLQQMEDSLKEKLKVYWDHLSNATLAAQPYPHARNVEMHSDGIINDVMTSSIEFDPALDEDKLVSKYWFRFSSDCSDLGRLEPDMPPLLILQKDPLILRYKTILGPIRVPEGSRCVMLYTADLLEMPFPFPVAIPLPEFRFPKPEVNYVTHCKTGPDACFEVSGNGTTCDSLMGKACCHLQMCVGCKECSQIRNLVVPQLRPRLYASHAPCSDRWERQGLSTRFGFSCADALRLRYMNCNDDVRFGLCRRTCHLCDPKLYTSEGGPVSVYGANLSPSIPSLRDIASINANSQKS